MTTDQRTATTYVTALLLTGAGATGMLMLDGYSLDGLDFALRTTGRIAFVVLITVFAARVGAFFRRPRR